MSCENTTWTVELERARIELRPYTVDYRSSMGRERDYAKLKFAVEVGEAIPEDLAGTRLADPQLAYLKYGGERKYPLYYTPDSIQDGIDYMWLELRDPLEHLTHGQVDIQWDNATIRSIYQDIYDSQVEDTVFNGLKFSVPGEVEDYVEDRNSDLSLSDVIEAGPVLEGLIELASDIADVFRSHSSFDESNMTPLEVFDLANDTFGLEMWVGRDGVIWVGKPETTAVPHIAASHDERVWKITENGYNISEPRHPVGTVAVRGRNIDVADWVPGDNIIEDWIEDQFSWTLGQDTPHFTQVRPEGIATTEDTVDAEIQVVEVEGAKDATPRVAKQLLIDRMTDERGTVRINSRHSGTRASHPADAELGDVLYVVGVEEDEDCRSLIETDWYVITGVQHRVDGRSWTTTFDVTYWPDISKIRTFFRYFDPTSGEYLKPEEVYG